MDMYQCYEHGISGDRDSKQAFELLNEAHKSGDVPSIVYFARCFEFGIGTERNMEKAAALYREAMSQGIWYSKLHQCYYGYLLIRGGWAQKLANIFIMPTTTSSFPLEMDIHQPFERQESFM